MNVFSLIAFTVYAAETIISPLPDGFSGTQRIASPPKPTTNFGQLISPLPDTTLGQVLGEATTAPPVIASATKQSPEIAAPTGQAQNSSERSRDDKIDQDNKPQQSAPVARKKHFTIALLGDSMIDTLGPDAPHLKSRLSATFPATRFTILNYGVGGTNVEYGLERLTHDYTYLGNHIQSLVSQRPDIVVVESFGYNPFPFDTGALDKHWLTLAKIVDVLKGQLPGVKIVIAATIAPNAKTFGDGAAGLSFGTDDKWKRVDVIKKYLESTVRFAKSERLPLADAFHPSLQSDGNGNPAYINAGDHIHYSDPGRAFFAQKVTEAIVAHELLR